MTSIGTAASTDLARITASEFRAYFRHLATRVERAARSVTAEQLWTKPFPFGNSIGHLVLHLTGNLNHYIGALIADSGYVRHREHEFTDPARYPLDEVLARFHQAVDMVVKTLEAQDANAVPSGCGAAADSDATGTFSGLRRPHEQSHRPDELSGPGVPDEHERAARMVNRRGMRGSIP